MSNYSQPNLASDDDHKLLFKAAYAAWLQQQAGPGLPDQTGQAGKFLSTDGTDALWTTLAGGGDVAAQGTLTNNSIALGAGATSVKVTTTGTGVVTALGTNVGSAGAVVVNGGALGTPSSGTGTNITGLVATNTTVDDTGWEVLAGATDVQDAFGLTDTALLNARSTGIRYGGAGSVDGGVGVGTTVSVTAGAGQILDNSDPENPTFTSVTWGAFATQAPSVTPGTTYWYIDSAGNLQQTTTAPDAEDCRTRINLFQSSTNGGVITSIANLATPIQQTTCTIRDLSEALGPIRVSGSQPTYVGANLKLKVTSGVFYDLGATWWTTPISPNTPTPPEFNSNTGGVFRYITTSGVINVNQTDIQVANYQVAGVVTAIPGANTRVGIHYVIGFPSGNTRLSYGIAFYNNFTDALAALSANDPYNTLPSTVNRSNSFILGAVLAVKNATDLSNAAQATFVTTNRFGQFAGAVAIAGSSYVQGPASATDGVPALFDGTTGKIIKNSTPTGTGNPVMDTSPTIATSRLSLGSTLAADGDYNGTTQEGTAGATLAFGDLCYFAAADSRWELADASAAATAGEVMLGFCVLAAAADGDPTRMLLQGKIRADAAFPTFTISAPIYVSETAGDVTQTKPTTTDSVTRVLGFAQDANTMWVSIDGMYLTHA